MSLNIANQLEGKVFETGYKIVESKGTVIIGMSPGNSYFTKETIKELVDYCAPRFEHVAVMIPSLPSIYNYLALGYSQKVAEEKARHKSNTLRNRSANAIAGYDNVEIIDWKKDIASSELYSNELKNIMELYNTNAQFNNDCKNTTKKVLEDKLKEGACLESAADIGVNYLLEEFAGISLIPKLFGKEQVAYAYHHRWPVFENYVNGVYGKSRDDLGLIIIKDSGKEKIINTS